MNPFYRSIIALSRPLYWFLGPVLMISVALYYHKPISFLFFLQMLSLTFPISFIIFGTNEIYDHTIDLKNKRKQKYVKLVSLTKKNVHDYKVVLLVSALIMLGISLLTGSYVNILLVGSLILVGFFYSAPPLRFKERFFIDSISNIFAFLLPILIGFTYFFPITSFPPKGIIITLLMIPGHIVYQIVDIEVDQKTGQKTTATLIGRNASYVLALIFTFIVFIYFLNNIIITTYILLFFLLNTLVIIKKEKIIGMYQLLLLYIFIIALLVQRFYTF